jgi:hypothetical protein
MKMRHFVVATSAALVSLGAIAAGQQHSQDKASVEATIVREAQSKLRSQGYAPTPQDPAASGASSERAPQPSEKPKD